MDYYTTQKNGNEQKEATTKGPNMGPQPLGMNTIIRVVEITNVINRTDL